MSDKSKKRTPSVSEDEPSSKKSKIEQNAVSKNRTESTDQEDFPRGLEVVKPKKQKNENDSEKSTEKKAKDQLKSKPKKAKKIVEPYLNLHPGITLLCAVRRISSLHIEVSMPPASMHRGRIEITEISDVLAKRLTAEGESAAVPDLNLYFRVGDLVRCYVLQVEEKWVQLSMRSSNLDVRFAGDSLSRGTLLNGSVQSIEDHGYVIHLGLARCNGFVTTANASTYLKKRGRQTLEVGEPVLVGLLSYKANSRTLELTLDHDKIKDCLVKDEIAFTSLSAGMLVDATVTFASEEFVLAKFLGAYKGYVTYLHLKPDAVYKTGENYRARIISVDYQNKIVGLSFKKHLVQYSHAVQPKIENESQAIVYKIDKERVYLHPAVKPDAIAIIAKENAPPGVKIGDPLPIEIKGYQRLDGSIIAGLGTVLPTTGELKVGQIIKGTVKRTTPKGLEVQISANIIGRISDAHLSDHGTQIPENWPEGSKIRAKVLDLTKKRRPLLTMKPKLMRTKGAILTFEDAKPNNTAYGFVTKITPFSCFVSFFGEVFGRVVRAEFGPREPPENFAVGHTVKCRVLKVNPRTQKMELSFITDPKLAENAESEAAESPQSKATETPKSRDQVKAKKAEPIGQKDKKVGKLELIGGTVTKVDEDSFTVETKFGEAEIPSYHLSDFPSNYGRFLKRITPGSNLERILVLKGGSDRPSLTLKPTLVEAAEAGDLPSSFGALEVGSTFPGFVVEATAKSLKVQFAGRLRAEVLASEIDDSGDSDPTAIPIGTSVRAHILSKAKDKKSMQTASLKASLVGLSKKPLVQAFFEDEERIAGVGEKSEADFGEFPFGAVVQATLKKKEHEDKLLQFEPTHGVKEICAVVKGAANYEVGETYNLRVLDVDKEREVVEVSGQSRLVSIDSAENFSERILQLEEGKEFDAVVELVVPFYAVVSLNDSGLIGFALTMGEQNLVGLNFSSGDRVRVEVVKIPSNPNERLLLRIVSKLANSKRTSATATNGTSKKKKVGK
eukprot:TRINITY_DN3592_c0_g1_i1.p1 TRINITY_DN3592_c0_g1~~TRINITY_DN3592_c0_g1_i1.p1  ORF type:complete len:1011 (-),score=312.54 TRINITY_DN3592_c0_g1_i1:29-3061(-)